MSRRERRRRVPPDPEPWLRRLPPELRSNPKSVAWAKAKHENDEVVNGFNRKLVDFYKLHTGCPLKVCRRARRCAGRKLLCYEASLPLLQKHVFPKIRAALNQRAAEAALRPESPL